MTHRAPQVELIVLLAWLAGAISLSPFLLTRPTGTMDIPTLIVSGIISLTVSLSTNRLALRIDRTVKRKRQYMLMSYELGANFTVAEKMMKAPDPSYSLHTFAQQQFISHVDAYPESVSLALADYLAGVKRVEDARTRCLALPTMRDGRTGFSESPASQQLLKDVYGMLYESTIKFGRLIDPTGMESLEAEENENRKDNPASNVTKTPKHTRTTNP